MTTAKQRNAEWIRSPERSNLLMLRIMTWISLNLGRSAGRAVLHLIAAYFVVFAPASRRSSRQYLQRVLPHSVRLADIYRHFFWFASVIHDRVYLLNQRFDLYDIEVHGEDVIRAAVADGGALLFGAHMGSFEILRALGQHHAGLDVAMAMYEDNARKINQIMTAINPAAQQNVIGLGRLESMLKIRQVLEDGTLVGVLADRALGEDSRQPVMFLDGEARLPLGPFRMAAILRKPVVFMVGLYLGGNRYAIHFEKLADFSAMGEGPRQLAMQAAMTKYAALLEKHCKQSPYNWFNFFNFWQMASGPGQEDTQ